MKSRIFIATIASALLLNSVPVFASAMHPTLKDEYRDYYQDYDYSSDYYDDDYDSDSYDSELDSPRLKNVFATKDTFDPGENESTQIVFTLTEEADTKVTIYRKEKKLDTIFDENDLEAGTYAVEWDGEDIENDFYTYTYKIEAENSEGDDEEEGEIQTREEEKSGGKPNITRDETDDLPYFPQYNNLNLEFRLDRDADITLEIRIDDEVIATPIEDDFTSEGYSEISWDGEDDDGDQVEDGVYTYKLIAENSHGKDIEFGNFEIQDSFEAKYPAGKCGGFKDVSKDNHYCSAIKWAKENNIFEGYYDSTFKPNQSITRAEALKVVLKALDISVHNYHGTPMYFNDVEEYEWYSSYLQTALDLGIVHGYADGSFRPHNEVTRFEGFSMLYYATYAADEQFPSKSIKQAYYSNQIMTRAAMADMLYRYSNM